MKSTKFTTRHELGYGNEFGNGVYVVIPDVPRELVPDLHALYAVETETFGGVQLVLPAHNAPCQTTLALLRWGLQNGRALWVGTRRTLDEADGWSTRLTAEDLEALANPRNGIHVPPTPAGLALWAAMQSAIRAENIVLGVINELGGRGIINASSIYSLGHAPETYDNFYDPELPLMFEALEGMHEERKTRLKQAESALEDIRRELEYGKGNRKKIAGFVGQPAAAAEARVAQKKSCAAEKAAQEKEQAELQALREREQQEAVVAELRAQLQAAQAALAPAEEPVPVE